MRRLPKRSNITKQRLAFVVSLHAVELKRETFMGCNGLEFCTAMLSLVPANRRTKNYWRQLCRHLEDTGGRLEGFVSKAGPSK